VKVHKTYEVCQYLKPKQHAEATVSVQQTFSSLPNTSNVKTINCGSKLRFKMSIQAVLMVNILMTYVIRCQYVYIYSVSCNTKGEIFVLIIRRVSNCPG
jgi:hypothetical protein